MSMERQSPDVNSYCSLVEFGTSLFFRFYIFWVVWIFTVSLLSFQENNTTVFKNLMDYLEKAEPSLAINRNLEIINLKVGIKEITAALQVENRVEWIIKLTQHGKSMFKGNDNWSWKLLTPYSSPWAGFSVETQEFHTRRKPCVSEVQIVAYHHMWLCQSAWYVAWPVPGRAQAAHPLNQIRIFFPRKWTKTRFQPYVWKDHLEMPTLLRKTVCGCPFAKSNCCPF